MRRLVLVAALLSGMAAVGCSRQGPAPWTVMRCVVTMPDGRDLECDAPDRAFEGDPCNCAVTEAGGRIGPVYLGRARSLPAPQPQSKP